MGLASSSFAIHYWLGGGTWLRTKWVKKKKKNARTDNVKDVLLGSATRFGCIPSSLQTSALLCVKNLQAICGGCVLTCPGWAVCVLGGVWGPAEEETRTATFQSHTAKPTLTHWLPIHCCRLSATTLRTHHPWVLGWKLNYWSDVCEVNETPTLSMWQANMVWSCHKKAGFETFTNFLCTVLGFNFKQQFYF